MSQWLVGNRVLRARVRVSPTGECLSQVFSRNEAERDFITDPIYEFPAADVQSAMRQAASWVAAHFPLAVALSSPPV